MSGKLKRVNVYEDGAYTLCAVCDQEETDGDYVRYEDAEEAIKGLEQELMDERAKAGKSEKKARMLGNLFCATLVVAAILGVSLMAVIKELI